MTEAQRLADKLIEEADYDIHHEAKACMQESARELRRLDAIESKWAALSHDDGKAQREIERLRAVNAQLLEFAEWMLSMKTGGMIEGRARAAIAAQKGKP